MQARNLLLAPVRPERTAAALPRHLLDPAHSNVMLCPTPYDPTTMFAIGLQRAERRWLHPARAREANVRSSFLKMEGSAMRWRSCATRTVPFDRRAARTV